MAIVLLELGIYEPSTQIAGAQAILDLEGMTWAQVWHVDLKLAVKMIDYIMVKKQR